MKDDLTLVVTPAQGGASRELSGWTGVRVTVGAERIPNDFTVALTETYPGEAEAFVVQPQDRVEVYLGSDLTITGYVDDYTPSINAGSHFVQVRGRGKSMDLVDCAAIWPGGQISGSSAVEVARKLALAYGVTVESDVTGLPEIVQFNLSYGETSADIIERICRYSALLYYERFDGTLFLTRIGSDSMASGLVEGINIESASTTFSAADRFSVYNAYALPIDTYGDIGFGGNLLASVPDPTVYRRRERAIVAESVGGAVSFDLVQRRAAWEMNRRNGRSRSVIATVDSWRDVAGRLWTPNTLVDIVAPTLKVNTVATGEKWVIASAEFTRDESGTHARVVAYPPAAFAPQPVLLQPDFPDVPYLNGPVPFPPIPPGVR